MLLVWVLGHQNRTRCARGLMEEIPVKDKGEGAEVVLERLQMTMKYDICKKSVVWRTG